MLYRSLALLAALAVATCAPASSPAVPHGDGPSAGRTVASGPLLYLARYVNGVSSIEVRRLSDGALQRTLSGVNGIDSMAIDREGTLYAFDQRQSQERRFTRVLEFAAGSVRPDVVIPRDHGSPFTVFVDADDRLVVPDFTRSTLSFFNRGERHPWRVTRAGLCWPWGLASDGAGHLWVSNENCPKLHTRGSIVELGDEGTTVLRTITEGVGIPWRIALDGRGGAYIVTFSSTGETINLYSMATGRLVSSTNVTNDRAGFVDPQSPAADSNGNIYVHYSGCVASTGYQHCVDAINVYSPGNVTPSRTLEAGANGGFGNPAFDHRGNAYVVVGHGGTHPTSEVRVYSAGASKSRTLLREPGLYEIAVGD